MFSQPTRLVSLASLVALVVGITSCDNNQASNTPSPDANSASPAANTAVNSNLTGTIKIDGSSTVLPVSEAMAEEFQKVNSNVQVTVGESGTGGGFKKFCAGETDISNASRPIKAEEVELCQKGGIEYVELPVFYDGISVVVNPQNNFAECLKVDDLKKMWEPAAQGKVNQWQQIRSEFPAQKLTLYGPGTDSGTYDFFTDQITGEEGSSRGDFTASEDDNTLVQGVSGDQGALGYFGYAYYANNKDRLKLVAIDAGKGCVQPSEATINNGSYAPLSRPVFIYVKKDATTRPEVKAFVDYHLSPNSQTLVTEVGYVPLPNDILTQVQSRFQNGTVGSLFADKSSENATLKE